MKPLLQVGTLGGSQERDNQLDFDPADETEHKWARRDRVSASEADPWP